MHFCSSPKVDPIKQENSRGILYLKLVISEKIVEKIRDKESRGNNDICHARVSRYNLLRYSMAQSLLHRWEAIFLWSLDNSQNGKVSFFFCVYSLENPKPDLCLFILVKIFVFNPRKILYRQASVLTLSIFDKSKKNHEFFLRFSRENHFASIHSISLRYYYVIAKFDNALQLEPS